MYEPGYLSQQSNLQQKAYLVFDSCKGQGYLSLPVSSAPSPLGTGAHVGVVLKHTDNFYHLVRIN
jgi:hypothetical protein